MTETLPTRLAVARLLETGGPAAAVLRPDRERPLAGYCLLTGAGARCRITIYLENGAAHEAVMEGDLVWLQQGEPQAVLASAGLRALGTAVGGAEPLGGAAGLATGEPDLLAEGDMRAALAQAGPEPAADDSDESEHIDEHVPPDHEVPRTSDPAEGPDFGARMRLTNPFAIPPSYPVPDPFAAPEPEPHVDLFKWIPQPAVEVFARPFEPELGAPDATTGPVTEPPGGGAEPAAEAEPTAAEAEPAATGPSGARLQRETLSVPLTGRHPLTPRAGGTALLQLREGRVQLTVRGLPTPAALGRDPGTDRPYSIYRAWLVSQRAATRQPLGVLTRVWGENFRLESEPDLPLSRFDAVLVTADDRAQPLAPGSAPQVLMGSYPARD